MSSTRSLRRKVRLWRTVARRRTFSVTASGVAVPLNNAMSSKAKITFALRPGTSLTGKLMDAMRAGESVTMKGEWMITELSRDYSGFGAEVLSVTLDGLIR